MLEQRKVVTAAPENSETPLERARSWVTPNRLFFVRNHFPVPTLDADTWRLPIEGCVERPLVLSYDELAAMPERTVFATMECAGNGRSFLEPRPPGVPWGAGAIGHAEWTGVPLRAVLEKAGLRSDAREVVFEGHDSGTESDHPEKMFFARGLPVKKAMHPDTLLALRMNGEVLEPSHGFPVRLIVPGWYGVASVKWLKRISVQDAPFPGYYQTIKYTVQKRGKLAVETVPVAEMAIKSEIVRPHAGETLGVGMNRLFGLAWAGEDAVGRVQISTDGGRSWLDADLVGPSAPYSWTLWEYLWEVAEPGRYALVSRAITAQGQVQPTEHDSLLGGYMISFSRPREVVVEGARRSLDHVGDAEMLLYDMNSFAELNTRLPLDVEMQFSGGGGI